MNHSEAYNQLICILEPVPVYVVLSVFVITGQYTGRATRGRKTDIMSPRECSFEKCWGGGAMQIPYWI